jgi:hypothetical protein
MVVSVFGPHHCLVHDGAPTERVSVILTPWAIPLALGLGAIHPTLKKSHFSNACLVRCRLLSGLGTQTLDMVSDPAVEQRKFN